MGLFDQIVNAVGNANQAGTTGQVATILSTVQQLGDSYGAEPSAVQSVLSVVGNHVRDALQQKQATEGDDQAQAVVNQYSGTYPNPQAVHSLFSPDQQQQVTQDAAQRTGLNPGMIQEMLPVLVPLVLNLLQTGSHAQNPQGEANPVLGAFLNAAQGGDVANVVEQLAGRFLKGG